jgi:3-oxoadipate enol-lactonase
VPNLSIDGCNIHYLVEGRGPLLVLLHSLGGDGRMWRTTIEALKAEFTVAAPDARGHGRSDNKGPMTVEQFAEDAVALAGELAAAQFSLIGLSMGGQAAMHVAASHSDQVKTVAIADTSLGGRPGGQERWSAAQKRIQEIGNRAFAAEYTASRLRPSTNKRVADEFSSMVEATLPDIYLAQFRSIQAQDLREAATTIRVPTLVLVGADDVSTPPSMAQEIASVIPGSRLEIIDDANHLSNLDQPLAFNAAVLAFARANGCIPV